MSAATPPVAVAEEPNVGLAMDAWSPLERNLPCVEVPTHDWTRTKLSECLSSNSQGFLFRHGLPKQLHRTTW